MSRISTERCIACRATPNRRIFGFCGRSGWYRQVQSVPHAKRQFLRSAFRGGESPLLWFMWNEGEFVSTKVDWEEMRKTGCAERRRFRLRTTGRSVFPGTYRANADRDSLQRDSEIASTHPPTGSSPRTQTKTIVRPCRGSKE